MKTLKKFEEKELKNFSEVMGGNVEGTPIEGENPGGGPAGINGPGIEISFTINGPGWLDGSLFGRLFDGIRHNANINEFDEGKGKVTVN